MKPGYKTTEFYIAVIVQAVGFVSALANELPPKYAAILSAVVTTGYALARGLAKVYPPKPPA
jgi:Na+/proline symporter